MSFDLRYRPPSDGIEWLRQLAPARLLILGRPGAPVPDDFLDVAADVRGAPLGGLWPRVFHTGAYAAFDKGEWWALLVRGGQAEVPARDQVLRTSREEDLPFVRKAIEAEWGEATKLVTPEFAGGSFVRIHGENTVGTVRKVRTLGAAVEVDVVVDGVVRQLSIDAVEQVDGDPTTPEYWLDQEPSSAEEFAMSLTVTKLTNALSDVLYSYASSKTVFRPYQFLPVIKLLRSSTGRLLIADEVGLGKTIEAGLIWSELEQRTPLRRVLLVTPASLREKWRMEMNRRFDRQLDVLRVADIERLTADLRAGLDPAVCGVISVESLRRPLDLLEQLAELAPRFDLIIVDEAHSLRNRDTSTFILGRYLSDWAEHLVFLSATPINLGNDDLFNLVNILEGDHYLDRDIFESQLEPNAIINEVVRRLPEARTASPMPLRERLQAVEELDYGRHVASRPAYRDLLSLLSHERPLASAEIARAKRIAGELNTLSGILTRTTKRDVPDARAVREPVQLDVAWTSGEREFYETVERMYRRKAERSNAPVGFIMQMPLRQAASCIPAMVIYLRERILSGNHSVIRGWADDDETYLDAEDAQSTVDPSWEPAEISELDRAARSVGDTDTKFNALVAHLRELRGKGMPQVMLFSFFRRTLAYLASRLSNEFSLRVMTGATPVEEREIIMRDFRAGDFDLLLLSEVGSEGLDFEFCSALVNYDLPWNPMRVEQRIGRLDRFGQRHDKIFIINMHVPGTIETDIFERLYIRIGVFERSIGELEPILRGDDLQALSRSILDPKLTPQQRSDKASQVAEAIARKEDDIKRVRESRGLLAYADQLEIDGITNAGPADGRYVGAIELRRLVERYLTRYGSFLEPHQRSHGVYVLRSTPALRSAFATWVHTQQRRGEFQRVQQLMSADAPFAVTFASDVASVSGAELLSNRHPLIRCAGAAFVDDPLRHRFASIAIPGLRPGQKILARIDIVKSTGLAPRTELWATGLDIDTGRANVDVERLLLTALAEGTISQGPAGLAPATHLPALDDVRALRRYEAEQQRRSENESLVDARAQARRQMVQGKIGSSREALKTLIARNRGQGVIRATQARIERLQQELARIETDFAPTRIVTVSSTPIAYALISSQP